MKTPLHHWGSSVKSLTFVWVMTASRVQLCHVGKVLDKTAQKQYCVYYLAQFCSNLRAQFA